MSYRGTVKIEFPINTRLRTTMSSSISLDTSLPLSEIDDEEFLEYYIRMDTILLHEREALETAYHMRHVDMKIKEEEEELEYYIRMCEDN